jgi:hypothetical protein
MSIEGKRDALYPGYVLPDADAVFKALHADAYMRTTPENVEDVMNAVRRVVEAAPASAQPDRGAAQEFDQAKFMQMVREFAEVCYGVRRTTEDVGKNLIDYVKSLAAPSTASQPVAPAEPFGHFRTINYQDGSSFTFSTREFNPETFPLYAAPAAAVAPSDAKGKADAANAGDCKLVPVEPTVEMRNACYEEYHRPGATYTSMCRAIIAAAPGQSPATSAADAKDAVRGAPCEVCLDGTWRPARFLTVDLNAKDPIVQEVGKMPIFATWGTLRGIDRTAVIAAMAAAPSSEKGDA